MFEARCYINKLHILRIVKIVAVEDKARHRQILCQFWFRHSKLGYLGEPLYTQLTPQVV